MNKAFWRGKSVFVTGHTGFKGSWLSLILARYGASVTGFSLPLEVGRPALYQQAGVEAVLQRSCLGDIRDLATLQSAMLDAMPEVVFHLAAQPLVRRSYRDPIETWTTNVVGTANVLEAVRYCPSVKAVVVVTTDKCYENREWAWGYRENDALGGYDPYSASKACAELVAASYRNSFLGEKGVLLATARAGNVIGGGDWSEDRLIPDMVRAVMAAKTLLIRNPMATRPWQHVLEALSGYICLAERLAADDVEFARAFNFGPGVDGNRTVTEVLDALQLHWPALSWEYDRSSQPHEANFLFLDTSLARSALGWVSGWDFSKSIEKTAEWYRDVLSRPEIAHELTVKQIESYFG